ncbi:MAG: hypothetical protein EON54_18645 [Alcaligenaceae bacterium]|nr:MAG: hypothetical protein EON54_18645 [Alcaligenaceae bacterium]
MIALLHYAIPAFIFAMVLIATRNLFEDGRTGEASSLLKQVLPALAAAVLGWFTLPFVERLLAVRFLAGGPKENALADKNYWVPQVVGAKFEYAPPLTPQTESAILWANSKNN